jgi:hypothetical protein
MLPPLLRLTTKIRKQDMQKKEVTKITFTINIYTCRERGDGG